jgi:formylmethanofuran dehydrogenase subunit C
MLRLSPRHCLSIPVDASVVSPDRMLGLTRSEIERLEIRVGNRLAALAEFFAVDGDANQPEIVIEGDCTSCRNLGSGMANGLLRVEGHGGQYLGSRMSGGRIEVQGSSGDGPGAEMSGGLIDVQGDAGAHIGSFGAGAGRGQQGGTILVQGNAWEAAGMQMRRGVLAIKGNAGRLAGAYAQGGTLLIGKTAGDRLGFGLKLGSIIVTGWAPQGLTSFAYDGCFQPTYLGVLARHLERCGFERLEELYNGCFASHRGDLAYGGRGEVLYWTASSSHH